MLADKSKMTVYSQAMKTLPYFDNDIQLDELIKLYQKKVDYDDGVNRKIFESLNDGKYSYKVSDVLPTSDEVINYLLGLDISRPSLPETQTERGQAIEVEKVLPKSKKDDTVGEFVLSKTSTGLTKSDTDKRHRLGKLKTIDKLRYGAEHFYNSTNIDNVMHEKDGMISKMRLFDYKIHKPIKKSPTQSKSNKVVPKP